MNPSVNGQPSSPQKPSCVQVNDRLNSLRGRLDKNPNNFFDVAQELLTLFPVQDGLAEPEPRLREKEAPVSHANDLAKNLQTRIVAKMGGKASISGVRTAVALKAAKGCPSVEAQKNVQRFVEACLTPDGVSVSFAREYFCFLGILAKTVVFSPFAILGFIISIPYLLVKLPGVIRDKIARSANTRCSLAVYTLLSQFDEKLASPQVTNDGVLKLIGKILKEYGQEGRTPSSDSSKEMLDQLNDTFQGKFLADRDGFTYGIQNQAAQSPKLKFYTLVSAYLLETRKDCPAGSAPKNAGKELYRILIKNLVQFVNEDVQDVGQNVGSTAAPSAPLADLNAKPASGSYPHLLESGEEGSS